MNSPTSSNTSFMSEMLCDLKSTLTKVHALEWRAVTCEHTIQQTPWCWASVQTLIQKEKKDAGRACIDGGRAQKLPGKRGSVDCRSVFRLMSKSTWGDRRHQKTNEMSAERQRKTVQYG